MISVDFCRVPVIFKVAVQGQLALGISRLYCMILSVLLTVPN